VLGGEGRKMISEAPPLPNVYTADGQLLFTGSSITDGQGVWQSIGGQEIGTVTNHVEEMPSRNSSAEGTFSLFTT